MLEARHVRLVDAVIVFAGVAGVAGAPAAAFAAQAADSAAVARQEYRGAVADVRRGDLAAAEAKLRHAVAAWPTQPAYLVAHASIAARRADTAAAVASLGRLAALGLSHDVDADSDFVTLRGAPSFEAVARRLRANREPVGESTVAFALPDSAFFLEGIAHDPATGRWYLPSIRHGTVLERRADGTFRVFLTAAQVGGLAAVAAAVDPAARRLWVISAALPQHKRYAPADSGRSELSCYDLRSGRLCGRYRAPRGSAHQFGDLALGRAGDVFVSDTRASAVHRLRRGDSALTMLSSDPLLRSPQGMVATPDRRYLLVADYSHGLVRIDLGTGAAARLEEPAGVTLLGIDGLAPATGRALIAVQNGVSPTRVLRLTTDSDWTRVAAVTVLRRNAPGAGEPTLGVVAGGAFYYAGNSQWAAYTDAGERRPDVPLLPPAVLRIRLP